MAGANPESPSPTERTDTLAIDAARQMPSPVPADTWRRLSPWSVPHFVVSRIVRYVQAILFGIPATFGVSQTRFAELAWQVPVFVGAALSIWSVLQFLFTRYRITGDAVEMQRGALFRRRVNLSFARIQNVNMMEPFYFRALGLANLSIDSAGSAKDEIEIAALSLPQAEALRSWISTMRRRSLGLAEHSDEVPAEAMPAGTRGVASSSTGDGTGERFFERSLRDLVIYGLTNNRAFIAVAGIAGLFWQFGLSTADVVEFLGIDFDVIIAGLSLVRLTILIVLAFVLSIGLLALLSVAVSIVSYYGFAMYRRGERLIVRRGLINRHEIAVRKSRIQSVRLSQDWLDYLLDRRNIYLEQLTHAPHGQQHGKKHVMVPSVRLSETTEVTDEIWPCGAVEAMTFTPLSRRWLRKYCIIFTLINAAALAIVLVSLDPHPVFVLGAVAVWPLLMAMVYMTWKRGGLAIAGDLVVVRSGTVGINYSVFSTAKLQNVAYVQTPFMRRHAVGTLVFMTAASRIKVPYLPADFARDVVDYCLYAVEARPRSWM